MTVIPIFQSGGKENCFIQSGQVGEAGQKATLGYISPTHQIKNAQQAGYEESEIVSAVIGAVIPSLIFSETFLKQSVIFPLCGYKNIFNTIMENRMPRS